MFKKEDKESRVVRGTEAARTRSVAGLHEYRSGDVTKKYDSYLYRTF
ncbi:hypothetical protein BACCIP111899_00646 [Bacillus rhizoplanae]|uniref:Uncharacterized protein n=1 Tax=Bacillus rhizoplanae TaxID=2880966 RepID=A0ABN7ZXG7_9BACI|nr:hypothetical protein BACCIP111899_00646 [Bacillus rhizoplanae]